MCLDCDSYIPFQNLRVKAAFPSEFFKVKFSSRNGTYHIVETLLKGITHIDATLASVQKEVGMSGRQTIACPSSGSRALVHLNSSMNLSALPDWVYVVVLYVSLCMQVFIELLSSILRRCSRHCWFRLQPLYCPPFYMILKVPRINSQKMQVFC